MSNTEPQTTEQMDSIPEWTPICELTKVIYSISEEDDDSSIPSYLVGGLDLDIGSDYDSDSDNSTIPSYLVDDLDLDIDLDLDSEDEDDLVTRQHQN
jgi:hypothetical protein